jgi:hypothetical protein
MFFSADNPIERVKNLEALRRRFDDALFYEGGEAHLEGSVARQAIRGIVFSAWGGHSIVGYTPFHWGLTNVNLPKSKSFPLPADINLAKRLGTIAMDIAETIRLAPRSRELGRWVWEFLGLDKTS